ncbi:MAG TPA: ABC transporter ATP-binding protein [Anaerolineae bacterium]|nr:ABC transporter ATP-binding protein [Anaerolineae bacterium]
MTTGSSTISEFSVARSWQPDHRSPTRWLVSHVLRYKLLIVGVFVGAFGNGIGAALVSIHVGWGFDAIANEGDVVTLGWIALSLIGSQVIRGGLMLGRNFCSEIIGQRVERDTRDELYLSLVGKSMSFHDNHATGDLMARATNDVREINLLFNPGINLVVGSLFFIVAPFFLVPSLHPQLLLAPAIYTVAYIVALWDYLRQLRPATEAVRRDFGRLNATLAEAIDGVETVKGAAQEQREIGRFEAALQAWRTAYVWQGDIESKFIPLLLLGLLFAGGLLHSLLLFRQGAISLGNVVAFNSMLLMFQFPTFASQFAYSYVSTGLSSARRVLELITAKTELDQNAAGYSGPMDGSIRFEGVTFGYNGSAPALDQVSFEIKPGQTVALVGQTGAGKTTLTKLLNRTYDVEQGRISIGGHDVRDWNLETLRRQISIIEQDIYLFSRTVAENIAFGCPQASLAEIEAAAKAAQAHDFIMDFKDGYQTVVGERGVTLSGGQRQRLALARAFLTDPKILILDDSTSAIDSATEDKIQQAIERAAEGRTTLLITHRLSQIRWADLIVVLRQGRVAMIGTHEELMAKSEAYRKIFARYE